MAAFEAWQALAEQADHRLPPGRPRVSLCYAQSLDGSLTTRRGQQTALSGPESSRLTHQLRAAHDAILVGSGTILVDDPLLTARLPEAASPQPVILDGRLRTPPTARVLVENPRSAWIACLAPADRERRLTLEAAGARLLELPAGAEGRLSLPVLLDCLGEMGVRSLMVEGGAAVITSFLAQDLADLLVLTIAPVFMGGVRLIEETLPGLGRRRAFQSLRQVGSERLGEDFVIWGSLR